MKFFKTLFDIATLPVELAKDIVTMGGIMAEQKKSYTRKLMEQIDKNFEN